LYRLTSARRPRDAPRREKLFSEILPAATCASTFGCLYFLPAHLSGLLFDVRPIVFERLAMPNQPKRRGPKPKSEITAPQRRTLLEVERYVRRHQFAPTIQELADMLDISPASAHEQVNQLVRKGYLKRAGGKTRG